MVEATPADRISESPGARWPAKETNTAADVLGGGERLAPMVDRSTAMPEVAAKTARTSGAEAGVADATLEFGAKKPVVPEEQTARPEALKGVVEHGAPWWCLHLWRRRTRWKKSSVRNHDLKLSESSASEAVK